MHPLNAENGQAFDNNQFTSAFDVEAQHLQRSLKVESGFASVNRVKKLAVTFASKTSQGVQICAFIGTPDGWELRDDPATDALTRADCNQAGAAFALLSELKVHVNLVPFEHKKFIVVDNRYVWEGTLNALSYNFRTGEHMRRYDDPRLAEEVIRTHRLDQCKHCLQNRISVSDEELNMEAAQIGELIALRRKALKMSVTEFASLAKTTRATIHRIEKGLATPTLDLFFRISNLLGRNVAWLPPTTAANVKRIIQLECENPRV